MNSQINAIFEQSVFQFLCENALAANDAERTLAVAVSQGANDHKLRGNSMARETGAHKFGLPSS
jgi:hypothetical protein